MPVNVIAENFINRSKFSSWCLAKSATKNWWHSNMSLVLYLLDSKTARLHHGKEYRIIRLPKWPRVRKLPPDLNEIHERYPKLLISESEVVIFECILWNLTQLISIAGRSSLLMHNQNSGRHKTLAPEAFYAVLPERLYFFEILLISENNFEVRRCLWIEFCKSHSTR